MIKPAPSALALLLVLSPALVGCSTDTTAAPAAPATSSEPAMADDTMAADDAAMADDAMAADDAAMADDAMMADHGAWIDRAAYEADPAKYHAMGDVVLFFAASWCPTCKETVDNLDQDGVPAGLTVVRVDFDDSTELRKRYGITYQHTFVQVDQDGMQLATFTGTSTGQDIAARTV